MRQFHLHLAPAIVGIVALAGCSQRPAEEKKERRAGFSAFQIDPAIGGQKVIVLEQATEPDLSKLQFVRAEVLPGRGMNIYQIKAVIPGKGIVPIFEAPALEAGAQLMNGGPDDFNGNAAFRVGGAILLPYANRIRGKLLEKERLLETTIAGKKVRLPANWKGKNPGAEVHAMHGLILDAKASTVSMGGLEKEAQALGVWDAGDFGGHWPSKTEVSVSLALAADQFVFTVVAKNTGAEDLPIGVGWHPYFLFPSGNREQARLRIRASKRALVNNYDDVFPTGKVVPVAGTPYDFTPAGGAPLNKLFLDDCFLDLEKDPSLRAVAEIIDPAANYGLRVIGASPQIRAFQVYAPVDKPFVALEPQFNLADPYSPIWKGQDTGMVTIKPGERVAYTVILELFKP